jgi:hypothetical protein
MKTFEATRPSVAAVPHLVVGDRHENVCMVRKLGELEPFVHVVLPAQLSVATVQRLVDPLGRNISFGDKWTDRARQELTIQYAAKVRLLSPADLRLVTACAKTRNAIVHRSPGSVDEMNHERSRP